MTMTNPTITLNLTLQTTELILNALAAMPYGQVAKVIEDISKQAQEQIQPAPTQE